MTSQALLPKRTTFDNVDQRETRYARVATAGLTTAYSTTNVSCSASEIAFIDRIVVNTKTLDTGYTLNGALSATNVTSIVVAEINRPFIPVTGTITLLLADGTYTEIAYTNYATTVFTIASTDFSANNAPDNMPVTINGVNNTLFLEVNGRTLPFHMTSEPFASHNRIFEINPNGNMVLKPSESIRAKATLGATLGISIYYRKYQLAKARQLGLLEGGQIPDVASSALTDMVLLTTLAATDETDVVMNAAIPTWLPATGSIAIERDAGSYTVHAYTAYADATFTIASTDFSSDNATAANAVVGPVPVSGADMGILNAVSGQAVQVLGFYMTGHTATASADSLALGFWNGTGTFFDGTATKAATAHMIMVGHAQGRSHSHRPEVIVNNTNGCIEGPTGYGLYVEGTANVVPVTAVDDVPVNLIDVVVMYKMVKVNSVVEDRSLAATLSATNVTAIVVDHAINLEAPPAGNLTILRDDATTTTIAYTSYTASTFTIASTDFSANNATLGNKVTYSAEKRNVNDPTGDVPQTTKRRKRFWASTIVAPWTLGDAEPGVDVLFTQGANQEDCLVKIKGYVSSATGRRTGAADGVTTMSLGPNVLAPAHTPLTGAVNVSDADTTVATADASFGTYQTDINIPVAMSTVPGFIAFDSASGDMNARFQLAWGEITTEIDPSGFLTLIS